jgi:cell wall assembly regulator SMI1
VTKRDEWLLSLLDDPTPDNAGVFADWLDDHEEGPLAGWLRGASHPVALAWAVIHDWLHRHHPTMLKLLHGPADEAAFGQLEQRVGRTFPEDFKASYRIHNGSDDMAGILIGLPLMSLEEVGENWQGWADIGADFDDDLNDSVYSDPAGAVKLLYACEGWVPFVGGSQHYVALDFTPGPTGTVGQVINSGRDDEIRHVIAPNVTAFFLFVARQYVLGKVSLSQNEDDPGDPHWLGIAGTDDDLLTGIRDLLGLGPGTEIPKRPDPQRE